MTKNVQMQNFLITRARRESLKNQEALCIWLTGLSGAGKSTIANALEEKLNIKGKHTYILDGDNLRHGLNLDLGFSQKDRKENIRRVAEVAKLFVDAGLITIVSLISPLKNDRDFARNLFSKGKFFEIYISTSLECCEIRDTKGLYKKARSGKVFNFTGIDSPYEKPDSPEVEFDTSNLSIDECVEIIWKQLF